MHHHLTAPHRTASIAFAIPSYTRLLLPVSNNLISVFTNIPSVYSSSASPCSSNNNFFSSSASCPTNNKLLTCPPLCSPSLHISLSANQSILKQKISAFQQPGTLLEFCEEQREQQLEFLPCDVLTILKALAGFKGIAKATKPFRNLMREVVKSIEYCEKTLYKHDQLLEQTSSFSSSSASSTSCFFSASALSPSSLAFLGKYISLILQRFSDIKTLHGYQLLLPYLKLYVNNLPLTDLMQCVWALAILQPLDWKDEKSRLGLTANLRNKGIEKKLTDDQGGNELGDGLVGKKEKDVDVLFWSDEVLRRLRELLEESFGKGEEISSLLIYRLVFGLAKLDLTGKQTEAILRILGIQSKGRSKMWMKKESGGVWKR